MHLKELLVYVFGDTMYKDGILRHQQLKGVQMEFQGLELLKLSQYEFKLECYNLRMFNVIPMVTTTKIAIEYTREEMRREFKHFHTKKKKKSTKEDSIADNEGQQLLRHRKTNSRMTEVSPFLLEMTLNKKD